VNDFNLAAQCERLGHAWRSAKLYSGAVFDNDICFSCGAMKLYDGPMTVIDGEIREVEDVRSSPYL
jgi:hypothetical protein